MSSMRSSILPSLTSKSVLVPPPQSFGSASPSDTLQAAARQAGYIQQEIQALLDAQSAGLLSGLGKEPAPRPPRTEGGLHEWDDRNTSRRSSPGPIRLPLSTDTQQGPKRQQTLPLKTSRSLIHRALVQLSGLKASESSALSSQHASLASFLDNLSALAAKKQGIEDSIRSIEGGGGGAGEGGPGVGGQRVGGQGRALESGQTLAEEEASLSSEIHALEGQLYELRARLAHVRRQRAESENRLQARLSSWRGALAELEGTIKKEILEGRGLEDSYPALRLGRKQREGVWALPRERRTMELVREDVESRSQKMLEAKESADKEEQACVDGAVVWKRTVRHVEEVEASLAKEMAGLKGEGSSHGGSSGGEQGVAGQGMARVLDLMTETLDLLQGDLQLAEDRGWKLLVCAIGAELEALRQGRELLMEALEAAGIRVRDDQDTPGTLSMMTAKSRLLDDDRMPGKGKERADALDEGEEGGGGGGGDEGGKGAGPRPLVDLDAGQDRPASEPELDPLGALVVKDVREDDDEDDEPGPEFLVEHVDEG